MSPTDLPPRDHRRSDVLFGLVLAVVATGLAVAAGASRPFVGTTVIGLGFGLAAVCRMVLPERDAGLFGVRTRREDIALLVLVSTATITLALSLRG